MKKNHSIIDIDLEPRMVKGKAQAFWQGEYNEDDKGNKKEVWIWLPLSQIEIETSTCGRNSLVSMPEWLAMDKGLI